MGKPQFRKSVRCDTGSCVEVAIDDDESGDEAVQIRNSTDPVAAKTAGFTKQAWQNFVAQVKAGDFDA
jgi:uncharacterized protein DUF397